MLIAVIAEWNLQVQRSFVSKYQVGVARVEEGLLPFIPVRLREEKRWSKGFKM